MQDKDGHTAYDVAALHGQFDCARLLRALHWAKRKDEDLNSELQDRAERQKQEREKKAIDARLRKEAAERAYTHWAHKKSKPTRQPPTACRERQKRKSCSQTPHTCSSCKTSGTRKSSGKQCNPKMNSTIAVTMHQAKRNVESTGKPAKMHPYTNYPPKKHNRSSPTRLGRSTTTASTPAPPSTLDTGSSATSEENIRDTLMETLPQPTADREDNCHEGNTSMSEYPPPSELNLNFLKRSASFPGNEAGSSDHEDPEVHFLVGGMNEVEEEEEEYDEDEDIAFHDVGKANSLSSLTIKLLRDLGNNKSSGGSHSRLRHRRLSLSRQRRFSLGAIPEGQIVTNYSNESMASLDDLTTRPRLMDLGPADSIAWEEEEEGDQLQHMQDETLLLEPSTFEIVESQTEREDYAEECTEVGPLSDSVESKKPSQLQTLNIVNFAWDTTSNSVHTNVTKSPMVPANHPWPSAALCPLPRSSSYPSYQNTPATPPRSVTPNRPLTPKPKSISARGKVKMLETMTSHSLSSLPLRELENTHITDCSESSPTLTLNESPSGSASPPSPPMSSLPAHSLFGGMGGLASKSMVSLITPTPVIPPNNHEASTVYHTESSQQQQPKIKRRIKSAPNMLSLGQPLETSIFTFGGTLQH